MHTHLLYRSLVAPRVLGFLFAVLALLTSLSAHAQGGYVRGTVVDVLTGQGVDAASVELLRPDSSVVDRAEAFSRGSVLTYQDHQPARFTLSVPQPGAYLLRVSMTGYTTLWKRIEVSFRGRNRYFEAGELALKRGKVLAKGFEGRRGLLELRGGVSHCDLCRGNKKRAGPRHKKGGEPRADDPVPKTHQKTSSQSLTTILGCDCWLS